jgi:glycosyltransferase involved in cell wall biosynthesis
VKVLHVYSGNLYGGVERFLSTLARHRAACPRMEPRFALCFDGRLARELSEAGAPCQLLGPVRVSRPWTVLRARAALRRLVTRERPDVVLCHSAWPLAVLGPAARRAGAKVALFLHDPVRAHWSESFARRVRPERVLCNSAFVAGTARGPYPAEKVAVTPLAVPRPEVAPDARARIRAELGAPAEAVVILQASRLERWKGHRLLLEALGLLAKTPGWVAWIAGGPQRAGEAEYLEALRAQAAAAGVADRVRFLGQRTDVAALMAGADIHCQPNLGPEPFGLAYAEAMHAGLPVVGTALGGALEVVPREAGFLVEPRAEAVAEALGRLVASAELRAAMGRAAAAHAREHFSPERRLGELADRLEAL